MSPSVVALVPARAGSKRIPGKNTRDFFGHPLLAYTIAAAKRSGLFRAICVSSEDERTQDIATSYGVDVIHRRRPQDAQDDSPDIHWIQSVLEIRVLTHSDAFAILRPTSPFRTADTIRRAWSRFLDQQPCDSLRAVQPATETPWKMWRMDGRFITPVLPEKYLNETPLHSMPTQLLYPILRQNASLEIAWTRVVMDSKTISGTKVVPFFTEGYEGFDLNTEDDWARATSLVDRGLVALPAVGAQTPVPAPQ